MFSVVIPLYNKAYFLKKTIQSVLDQDFEQFELIIVDDGSTDGSLKVAQSFQDKRLRILSNLHMGVSVARNTGVAQAQFPWVAFLDADDIWHKGFLGEMERAIHQFPDEAIFASGRSLVYANRKERYRNPFLPEEGKVAKINYYQVISQYLPPINSSNSVVKRELLEEVGGFNESMRRYEDHELWFRLCTQKSVVFVNKELSYYTKHIEGSASDGVAPAADVVHYLESLQLEIPKLSLSAREWASKFLRRFILYTIKKGRKYYTKSEIESIREMAKRLLGRKSLLLFDFLKKLP